ncbi:MAG: SPOR domain-containing protein [Alphaproteobacteria bacterium]
MIKLRYGVSRRALLGAASLLMLTPVQGIADQVAAAADEIKPAEPAKSPVRKVQVAPGGGQRFVVVGAYHDLRPADRTMRRYAEYKATIVPQQWNNEQWYRVAVETESAAAARQLRDRLAAAGMSDAWTIAPCADGAEAARGCLGSERLDGDYGN